METEEKYEDSGDFIILTKEDSFMPVNESASYFENTLSPKISLDEHCKEAMVTLKEVLKENNSMKDALQKNNNEIKKQYEEIRKWKEVVTRDYNIQKEAIEKYKAFVKLLEKDKCTAEEKCKVLQNDVKILLEEAKEIILQKTQLKIALEQKENLLKEAEEKCKQLDDELQQLKVDNEKLKQESSHLAESFSKLQQQCQETQVCNEELILKTDNLEMKCQQLEADVRQEKNKSYELIRKVSELSVRLKSSQLCLQTQTEVNKRLEFMKDELIQRLEDFKRNKDERSYVVVPSELPNNNIKENGSSGVIDKITQTELNICFDCAAKDGRMLQLEMQLSEAHSAVNALEQNLKETKEKNGADLEISLPLFETTQVLAPEEAQQCTSKEPCTSVIEHQTGEKQKIRCKIENLLLIFKERLDSIVKQDKIFIEQLEKEVSLLRTENKELHNAQVQNRKKFESLKMKCDDLTIKNSENSKRKSISMSSDAEISQLKYTIDQLTAELLHAKFSHEEKETQKNELSKKMREFAEQAEAASAHKIQAECYAADYAAEHELRLKAEEELQRLKDECRELNVRLQYGNGLYTTSYTT